MARKRHGLRRGRGPARGAQRNGRLAQAEKGATRVIGDLNGMPGTHRTARNAYPSCEPKGRRSCDIPQRRPGRPDGRMAGISSILACSDKSDRLGSAMT